MYTCLCVCTGYVHFCGYVRAYKWVLDSESYFVCVIHGYLYVWEHLAMCMWIKARGHHQGSFSMTPSVWEREHHWTRSSLAYHHASGFLHPPALVLQAHAATISFLCGCWEYTLRSSCLYSKHCMHWAIFAVHLYIFNTEKESCRSNS